MSASCEYEILTNKLQKELINHGWGEMVFKVTSMKDHAVRIDIYCGKQYVFFIKKRTDFEIRNDL